MRAIREIGVKSDARSQEVRYIQRAYVPALYAASSLYEAAPGQVGVRTSHACRVPCEAHLVTRSRVCVTSCTKI